MCLHLHVERTAGDIILFVPRKKLDIEPNIESKWIYP